MNSTGSPFFEEDELAHQFMLSLSPKQLNERKPLQHKTRVVKSKNLEKAQINLPELSIRSSLVGQDTEPLVLSPTCISTKRKSKKKEFIKIKVKKKPSPKINDDIQIDQYDPTQELVKLRPKKLKRKKLAPVYTIDPKSLSPTSIATRSLKKALLMDMCNTTLSPKLRNINSPHWQLVPPALQQSLSLDKSKIDSEN